MKAIYFLWALTGWCVAVLVGSILLAVGAHAYGTTAVSGAGAIFTTLMLLALGVGCLLRDSTRRYGD